MATYQYTYLMNGVVSTNSKILFLVCFLLLGYKHKKNLIKTTARLAKPLTFAEPEPLPDWFIFYEKEIFTSNRRGSGKV